LYGNLVLQKQSCSACRYESQKLFVSRNPLLRLELESTEESLQNCLRNYTAQGDIECTNCRIVIEGVETKTDGRQVEKFLKTSDILVLTLARFYYDKDLGELGKITKPISFPLILNTEQYMTSSRSGDQYKLYGIINHFGNSIEDGHYHA